MRPRREVVAHVLTLPFVRDVDVVGGSREANREDDEAGDDDTAGVTLVVGTGRTAWVRLRSGADDAETLDAATRATRLAGECLALGKCGGGRIGARGSGIRFFAAHPGRQGAALVHARERVAGSRTRARVQLAVWLRRRGPFPSTHIRRVIATGRV